jgi:HAD superfamily hydrolase (TIGR01450 family)
MTATSPGTHLDAATAFARYEAIRPRLPQAAFPARSRHAPSLAEASEPFDGLVLDAFGVLNVGDSPIPGAVARMAELRARGVGLCVLTNAASYTRAAAQAKYRRLGFDFAPEEVVSSRDIAAAHLEDLAPGTLWAAIAAPGDDLADIDAEVADLLADPVLWRRAGGFLFLSSIRWTPDLQAQLVATLIETPRPVAIANPDLVAPREDGLTIEPGFWGHDLQDRTGVPPHFFGKPYPDAFTVARQRLGARTPAMVGDTLHTDVLGGRAAGMGTILVSDHGLFAGQPTARFIQRSGIVPDVIVPTT